MPSGRPTSRETVRQIQVLLGKDWTLRAIAREVGLTPQTVARIRDGRFPTRGEEWRGVEIEVEFIEGAVGDDKTKRRVVVCWQCGQRVTITSPIGKCVECTARGFE